MKRPANTDLWMLLADIHHPDYCAPAFKAAMNFLERNTKKVKGLVLLGDNMDCVNISRHTEGKPRLRSRGGIARDFARFNKDILLPIE